MPTLPNKIEQHLASGPLLHTHVCDNYCLGPLAFYTGSVGNKISLSMDARRAERARGTFQNGVVFSSRPVKVNERILLRVEICEQHWEGALRLGFTCIAPSPSCAPAPMAIPYLSDTPGNWVGVVPDVLAQLGSEMRFWVDSRGRLVFQTCDGLCYVLLTGVDVTRPLWAVIDVYGQTRAVLLLGSEKKSRFRKKISCPTQPPPPVSEKGSCLCASKGRSCSAFRSALTPQLEGQQLTATVTHEGLHREDSCSVCFSDMKMSVTLPCGHQCLCLFCANRVVEEFGTCPLCRRPIDDPL